MPLRLVVDENDLLRAEYLLRGEFDKAGEADLTEPIAADEENSVDSTLEINRNPWELLVLASWLLVPAVCVLLTKAPARFSSLPGGRYVIAHITVTHFLSWLALIFAGGLILMYFRVRRSPDLRTGG